MWKLLAVLFLPLVLFVSHMVAGQQPQEGTKYCRMGRNSVCPSTHPSIFPSVGRPPSWPSGQLKGSESQLIGSEGQREGFQRQLEGSDGQLERSKGQLKGPEGHSAVSEGQPGGASQGMDEQNFSPFYRSLSPLRVAAQKQKEVKKIGVKNRLIF